ncbi:hypothetical protein G6038_30450 [Rhodococcus sp. 14C212]|uniref:cation:proton antiporter domain-containing protein n=1 Tax=Rhodococcus sp. 14C212 TaxID=2711209 RepID=UPI0013ECB672|nr:cation:proton antiporter [Rhodococcus sp. 14C212]NGP09704.1 hypothetical protein [Rhodococcus sp. 14C212]
MILDIVLTTVGVLGAGVAALSAKMRRLPLSEPLLGLAAGVLLGPYVLDVLPLPPLTAEQGLLHETSRILLAISVMAVALRYPITEVRRQWRPVAVLLAVAMPGMAAVTAGFGWALLSVPVATAVLLGAALCPTDPVLASNVVTGEAAEKDLPARNRQILSLESGANDGLALPLVLGERYGATDTAPALFFTVVLALGILGVAGLIHVDAVSALFSLTLEAERMGADETVLAAGSLVPAASTVVFGVTAVAGRVLYRRATVSAARSPDRHR